MTTRLAAAIEFVFSDQLNVRDQRGPSHSNEGVQRLADALSDVLATRGQPGLLAELHDCIVALAASANCVSLAVTGLGWLGGGVPAVERMVTELLLKAEQEIVLTTYSMTPGTGRVWEALETALATGVRCTLIAHRIDQQHSDIRNFLLEMLGRHPMRFALYDFQGAEGMDVLHAKILVVDRRTALVGSANLTFHGMISAHELAVVVRGPAAEAIAGRVDLLLQSPLVRPYLE